MSFEHVPITLGEVPVVRNFEGLKKAVGLFALEDYACVLDTSSIEPTIPLSIFDAKESYIASMLTYEALGVLLKSTYPELHWSEGKQGPATLQRDKGLDKGVHHDYDKEDDFDRRFNPGTLIVGYHETRPRYGESVAADLEITFASPTGSFNNKDSGYLAELLDEVRMDENGVFVATPRTNDGLLDLTSFRSVRLMNGGTVAFTHKRPGARAQVHRFRTLSDIGGCSYAYTRFGYEY